MVLVVASLVAGVAAPRMFAALPGVRLNAAARKLSGMMRYARNLAVSECVPVQVTVSLADRRAELMVEAPPAAKTDSEAVDPPKISVYAIPEGIDLSLPDDANDPEIWQVIFHPEGTSSGGRLMLQSGPDRLRQVAVEPITGVVTVLSALE